MLIGPLMLVDELTRSAVPLIFACASDILAYRSANGPVAIAFGSVPENGVLMGTGNCAVRISVSSAKLRDCPMIVIAYCELIRYLSVAWPSTASPGPSFSTFTTTLVIDAWAIICGGIEAITVLKPSM